jgi:hypothetical protein
MVTFTIHNLGKHTIDNMIVSGPFKDIVMEMAEMFLLTYTGPPNEDLDYPFAEYIISLSHGQGKIIEYQPNPPQEIN